MSLVTNLYVYLCSLVLVDKLLYVCFITTVDAQNLSIATYATFPPTRHITGLAI